MNFLKHPPEEIMAVHGRMRIVNPAPIGFHLGVIGMWHNDTDMQMIHRVSIAQIPVDFVWTAAAYRGDVVIPLLLGSPSDWAWSPEETVGYDPVGNLALTKGGIAEHSAEAEAVFPSTPKVAAAIVRNVFYAPDPNITRSQPHHSVCIEWGLFENGHYVDDVTRVPELVERLFR